MEEGQKKTSPTSPVNKDEVFTTPDQVPRQIPTATDQEMVTDEMTIPIAAIAARQETSTSSATGTQDNSPTSPGNYQLPPTLAGFIWEVFMGGADPTTVTDDNAGKSGRAALTVVTTSENVTATEISSPTKQSAYFSPTTTSSTITSKQQLTQSLSQSPSTSSKQQPILQQQLLSGDIGNNNIKEGGGDSNPSKPIPTTTTKDQEQQQQQVSAGILSPDSTSSSILSSTIGYLSSFLLSVSPPKENLLPASAFTTAKSTTSSSDTSDNIQPHSQSHQNMGIDRLQTSEASIGQNVKDTILDQQKQQEMNFMDTLMMKPPELHFSGRDEDVHPILSHSVAIQLRKHFPRRYRDCEYWKLMYSLEQHGISMQTLYTNCQKGCDDLYGGIETNCPSVLIIQDTSGQMFGGFVTDKWRQNSGSGTVRDTNTMIARRHGNKGIDREFTLSGSVGRGRSYYGTGESFVFKVDTTANNASDGVVEVYPWSFKNDYFMLSEPDFLALGGGQGGKFTLYIDGDLHRGYSASTPTFVNDGPLGGDEFGEFTCVGVEIWTMI